MLRTQRLGEADRIVTLLGRERGLVRAVAKGVRKTNSKFGARLEPFMVADLQLVEGRTLDTITQAVTIGAYGARIAADWDAYQAASVVVETAERLGGVPASAAEHPQYVLLVGALRDLAEGERRLDDVRDTFLLRAMSLAGWRPSFVACARCGAPGPHERISLSAGGAVCLDCAVAVGATIAVSVDTMRVLWALLADHRGVLDGASPHARERGSGIVAAYAQHHLDRGLRSLTVGASMRRAVE